MQAEGIPVSPYSVHKALENTAVPVGSLPEDKLTTGQGLMQVDKLDFMLDLGSFLTPEIVRLLYVLLFFQLISLWQGIRISTEVP